MNDYSISRRDALNAMCDNCDAMQPSTGVCTHFPCTRYRAVEKLKPAQSERKKGKLIQNDNGTYSCSLCQSWIPEEQYHYARFCLYCWAKMEEQ